MSKGPGRVEAAILSAFRATPHGTFSTAELADIAFGTDAPNKAQRVSILRAAKSAAKRLFDAKEANWKAIRREAPQGEIIFSNNANLRSYAIGRHRRDFVYNYYNYPVEVFEGMVDQPDARDAELMAEGGFWWGYALEARLDMLGIDSGPERDAVAAVYARLEESSAIAAKKIGESFAKIKL